jgi:hypothetical protein
MKITLSILVAILLSLNTKAQPINCNSFCVTDIYNDSVQTQVSIQMLDSGFVNYPYIAAILDINGDTLSTGTLYYFGQIGETTQDYPSSLSNTDWSNFTGTIVFVYDNDTCSLSFPCNNLNTNEHLSSPSFTTFPNPATTSFSIMGNYLPSELVFYSLQGQVVKRVLIESENQLVFIDDLKEGTYYLKQENSELRPYLQVKQ